MTQGIFETKILSARKKITKNDYSFARVLFFVELYNWKNLKEAKVFGGTFDVKNYL